MDPEGGTVSKDITTGTSPLNVIAFKSFTECVTKMILSPPIKVVSTIIT